MKKAVKILFKSILILILTVFILLLVIPLFFKNTIKEKIVAEANKRIDATLVFEDYSLSLIRNFPDMEFRLKGVSIEGAGEFEGTTLAGFRSFGFVFDLGSILGKDAYRLKSLVLDQPLANAVVLADSRANWDIMKEDESGGVGEEEKKEVESESVGEEDGSKELEIKVEEVLVKKGRLSYTDNVSGIKAGIENFDLKLTGDFSSVVSELFLELGINGIDLYMDGEQYLNSLNLGGSFNIAADLDKQEFTLTDNIINVNDLALLIDGYLIMGTGDYEGSIFTDLKLATDKTEFKSLLSMVPAFFMTGFEDLRTEGNISLSLDINGSYNAVNSTLPALALKLDVNDCKAWYKGKPELISGLNFDLAAGIENKDIKGQADLSISEINLGELLTVFPSDSLEDETDTISAELELIEIPSNIDFKFTSAIDRIIFDPLVPENIKLSLSVKDGVMKIEDTGLDILGGHVALTGLYDTRDIEKPLLESTVEAGSIGIRKAYESFITVQKLAPVAEGMDGTASVRFEFSSLLKSNMMPELNSVNGLGRLGSSEIQLVNSSLFNKFTTVLKMSDDLSNTFKDVDVEFRVKDGRVYIEPFDTRLGKLEMTVKGDHGLDQTINYDIGTSVPATDLPSSFNTLVSGLAAQARLFGLEYTPPDTYNISIAIGGTVKDPSFRPSLGNSGSTGGSGIKESAREMVEQKVEEVKEVAREEVDKQLTKALEEAEKQAENIKAEAAKAAQRVRDEAAAAAQKLTDEAESKGPLAKIAAKKGADALIKEADRKAAKIEEEASVRADKLIEDARKKVEG